MGSNPKDAASVRFPPPLVFLISILLGYIIERFFLSWTIELSLFIRITIATFFILPGIWFLVASLLRFIRTGQSPEPWTSTPAVISEGVYRYSRNPMYLGMSLVQAGVAIFFANIWILFLVPCSMFVVYRIAILPEESYLEAKFGEVFTSYKQNVRRWI